MIGPGQPPTKGRAAIQRVFQDWFKSARTNYKGQVLDSGMSGDLAYVVYSGTQIDPKGANENVQGVVVYRRVNGEWKAVIDAGMDAPTSAK